MMVNEARVYAGTQSWFYPEWKGVFYDEFAEPDDFLTMYAQEFPFVEVDTSFYAVPKRETLLAWRKKVPPEFLFGLKVPREITHERAFTATEKPLREFFERVAVLEGQLGLVLFQLPPQLDVTAAQRLFGALRAVPHGVRCAIEFRHPSWFRPDIFAELDVLGVAAAAVDGPFVPLGFARRVVERATADFVYLRLLAVRGSVERFDRRVFDREADLKAWAALCRSKAGTAALFVTSSNYYEGFAVETVRRFQAACNVAVRPRSPVRQAGLFE